MQPNGMAVNAQQNARLIRAKGWHMKRAELDGFASASGRSMRAVLQTAAILSVLITLASVAPALELVENGNFGDRDRGWVRYSNFANADEVRSWDVKYETGAAVVSGSECRPQARVGLRSKAIVLPPPQTRDAGAVYRFRFAWQGKDVHRCGAFVRITNAKGAVIRGADVLGPAGTFDQDNTFYIALSRQELDSSLQALLYFYTDGQGELRMRKVSLQHVPSSENDPRILAADWNVAPTSSTSGRMIMVKRQGEMSASNLFPLLAADTHVLPGEKRCYACNKQTTDAYSRFVLSTRVVSRFWELGVAENIPFWLEPTTDLITTDSVCAVDATSGSLPELPPLPESRHAYLFYWGHLRYGKTVSDMERDQRELALIRRLGFTGLCVQDDYGLDYAAFIKGKALIHDYLTSFSALYREAGFRSPLVYGIFSGVDKGRVVYNDTDQAKVQDYLSQLQPILKETSQRLNDRLIVWPVDEPNDSDRRRLSVSLLALWRTACRIPLMTTSNWKSAESLGSADYRWVGFGDYPDFQAVRAAKIGGLYCSLDAVENPLRYRLLSGVHAWASGVPVQAYWHFGAISGSSDSDLDGKQEDLLCLKPGSDPERPVLSLPIVEAAEGLQDLRLLCALEAVRNTATNRAEIAAFLKELRESVPATDRLSEGWCKPAQFESMRRRAMELWIQACR